LKPEEFLKILTKWNVTNVIEQWNMLKEWTWIDIK
jgi:hypothetical protein